MYLYNSHFHQRLNPCKQNLKITPPAAKNSTFVIVGYALAISPTIGLVEPVILTRDNAIISFMLTVGVLIVLACKVDSSKLITTSTFQSGMNACICVMGIAWLGNTFVNGHLDSLKEFTSQIISQYPFVLAIALYFLSCLLYSQAATAKVIMPAVALALGMTGPENSQQVWILVASFAAASGLFILPTCPTTLAAIALTIPSFLGGIRLKFKQNA